MTWFSYNLIHVIYMIKYASVKYTGIKIHLYITVKYPGIQIYL